VTKFRAPIEVKRALAITLKKLAFGYSNAHIANLYGTGSSTVWEYTLLITEVLLNKEKLLSQFISIPSGPRLAKIIRKFKTLTGIFQMCGTIDGTHIRLANKPKLALVPADYWNRHDHHNVLLQANILILSKYTHRNQLLSKYTFLAQKSKIHNFFVTPKYETCYTPISSFQKNTHFKAKKNLKLEKN